MLFGYRNPGRLTLRAVGDLTVAATLIEQCRDRVISPTVATDRTDVDEYLVVSVRDLACIA